MHEVHEGAGLFVASLAFDGTNEGERVGFTPRAHGEGGDTRDGHCNSTEGEAQMLAPITLTVNGVEREVRVEARALLVHVLRDQLGLTGTHIGCDTSQCGACTVLIDGRAVKSCSVLAVQAVGAEITTIEGVGANGLHSSST